jgi:hypothetical protein
MWERQMGKAIRARVVAVKTPVRDLKPGDLFSEKDGSYWNRAMSGHALPQALICTNDLNDVDVNTPTEYVYRLTIVREGGERGRVERDGHVIPENFDPHSPPGS